MGVWERFGTLLAGGAKIAIELEASRVPAGGFVSGHAELRGGRKGVDVVGVHVSLIRTAVRPPGGSTTSEIQQRTVADNTIGSGVRLEPRGTRRLQFSFRVPRDSEPTDDDTSYRVRVEAELEGRRSPRAYHPLRVADATAGRPGPDAIANQFPGLDAEQSAPLLDALAELRWAHDSTDPERDFVAAEPRLAALVADGEAKVRVAALHAWSSVVAGRVGDEQLHLLQTLAAEVDADPDLLVSVAEAAGRVATAPGLAILVNLGEHDEAGVRKAVVQAVARLDKTRRKLELLDTMRRDADPLVRAAVVRAMVDFADDSVVVRDIAAHTALEPTSTVMAACIEVLAGGYGHGHADVARPVFDRLARHPEPAVRVALAAAIYCAEQDEASLSIARSLLVDPDPEVRYAAAAEVRNLPTRGQVLVNALKTMAAEDSSPRARRGAVTSLPDFCEVDAMLTYFEDLIAERADREVLLGIVDALQFRAEPQYHDVLETLARDDDPAVANAAESALQPNTG